MVRLAGQRVSLPFSQAMSDMYARDLRASLEAAGVIPFERIVDAHSLARDGFAASDFNAT